MPDIKQTEQERSERARFLEEVTNNLQFSMRDFLLNTYLRAIPANKFCGFWCALVEDPPQRGGRKVDSIVSRAAIKPYLKAAPAGDSGAAFIDAVRATCKTAPDEELRRNVLGCLDLTGFFKFQYLNANLMDKTSVYQTLQGRYPKVAAMLPAGWKKLNRTAREGRNDGIGHPNYHTFRDMTIDEWRTAIGAWIEISDCLHDAQNDAQYQRVKSDVERALKSVNSALYTLQDLAKENGCFTAQEVGEILKTYRYDCINGAVFCNKDEAMQCLSAAAQRKELEKEIAALQAEKTSVRQQVPQTAASAVIRTALDQRLQKIPPMDKLLAYKGEPLDGRPLQELAETHYFVLTASLLKSKDGRDFVQSRLLPALRMARRDPKKSLLVDSTTLYHLYKEREAYSDLSEKYRSTRWTPQREEERLALGSQCKELRNADSAYFFVRSLNLPPLGSPAPLSTDEESLLNVMAAHPFDRFCVLLCGAAGFVRMIDRAHLPFVLVGRVRSGAERPVCTLFPQLMPPAQPTPDEPLLADLLETYAENMQEEEETEAEPQPAAVQAEAAPRPPVLETPAQPAAPKQPPQQAAPEAPASPAPAVQPTVQAAVPPAPKPAAAPRTEPKRQRHGVDPFPANLPLRKMDETLLPLSIRPVAGLTLRTEDGSPVTLRGPLMEGKEEAHGGEGDLFLTNTPGQVAKIYNAQHLTAGRRDKLDEMLRHDPQILGLCWPTHMLYTVRGDFVGYTMPQAPKGALPFSKSVLRIGSPSVHKELLPDWDRMDLVQAARSVANMVAQLHRCNILMGDVNAGNFMIDPKNSKYVYVVDTDSFQLGGFPCPVGVEDFTHPATAQRLGVTGALKFDTFLRTEDEENYVLAILLFKILFLNQNPFVTKTKMTYREAMAQKIFPYALQGDDFDVPDGDNWMIWKNLPRKITEAFTATFTEWKCPTAYEWARLLEAYAYSIEKYGFSRELAPAKYHEFSPDKPFYQDLTCPICHTEFNTPRVRYNKLKEKYNNPIVFCRSCDSALRLHGSEILPQSLVCSKCGRTYDATVKENMFVQAGGQTALCPRCKPRRTWNGGR